MSADSEVSAVPAIEVNHLNKTFGNYRAVADVSFTVMPGEIVGFLGPNGAGKSTTMRILAGLTQADSGNASLCGVPVATESLGAKRHLGYMPENNPLPEELRVIEYLRWRAKLKNVPRKKISERVEAVMRACDLARKARRKLIGTLSKGFRQRVGIADALLSEPDVIILDEPTIGLDPHQILGIRALIRSLRERKAVLISSHILPEIENVCDRVIIINGGRIVASGTPAELRREFILSRTFSVETNAPEEKVSEILGAEKLVPAETQREDSELKIWDATVPADREFSSENVVAALVGAGFKVREFREKRPSLEDIFIAATKRSYDIKE
ncbi:MAG: ABC transporter ATP-binding protein [Opitutales bacterium]|nr:ABC transporter ATP-binding protein [Opitutales bacterium]